MWKQADDVVKDDIKVLSKRSYRIDAKKIKEVDFIKKIQKWALRIIKETIKMKITVEIMMQKINSKNK